MAVQDTNELRKLFATIVGNSAKCTRRHVIVMANACHVSHEVVLRNLAEIDLVPSGSWGWFQANGGITDRQVATVLYGDGTGDADR